MATIRRQTDVAAPLAVVESSWPHFVQWVLTGHAKLACDQLVCIDALDSGNVRFEEEGAKKTRVVFELIGGSDHLPHAEIERLVTHDLLAFKDYIEKSRGTRTNHADSGRDHRDATGHSRRDSLWDPGESAVFWRR